MQHSHEYAKRILLGDESDENCTAQFVFKGLQIQTQRGRDPYVMFSSVSMDFNKKFRKIMHATLVSLPKNHITNGYTTLLWNINPHINQVQQTLSFLTFVCECEIQCKLKLPERMVNEVINFCEMAAKAKEDLQKMILVGKAQEAFNLASMLNSSMLRFQLGEFALEHNMNDIAKKFYVSIPENEGTHDAARGRIFQINLT